MRDGRTLFFWASEKIRQEKYNCVPPLLSLFLVGKKMRLPIFPERKLIFGPKYLFFRHIFAGFHFRPSICGKRSDKIWLTSAHDLRTSQFDLKLGHCAKDKHFANERTISSHLIFFLLSASLAKGKKISQHYSGEEIFLGNYLEKIADVKSMLLTWNYFLSDFWIHDTM